MIRALDEYSQNSTEIHGGLKKVNTILFILNRHFAYRPLVCSSFDLLTVIK